MPDLIRDLAPCPAPLDLRGGIGVGGRGVIPGLRQKQRPIDRRRCGVGDRVHADPDLAVPDLPQRSGVHPRHPGGIRAVLGKAAVVDDVGLGLDELIGPRRNSFPNLDVIPRRGGDELLQLLMVDTEPVGHRLHRLALAVQQQPAQVQLALGPLIRPRQPTEHLRGERLQPRPDLVHLLRSHANTRSRKEPDQP